MRSSNIFRREALYRLLISLLILAGSAYGVDPHRALSQYVRDHWGPEQGFPRGSIYAISQTTDGYLWIGAEAGLLRFDGWNFRGVRDPSSSFPFSYILGLVSGRDGDLWVRLRDRTLLRYHDGVFENPFRQSAPVANITAIATNHAGELLAARFQAGAFVYRNRDLELAAPASGVPRGPVLAVAETGDGQHWLGTRGAGLFRLQGGNSYQILKGLPNPKVNCLLADGNRDLWIGTDGGLVRWNGTELVTPPGTRSLEILQILSMTKDRDGNLWIGTNSRGLIRLNGDGVAFLDPPDAAKPAISSVFEDREGDIWFGSTAGLERLRDSPFVTYSQSEGLSSDGNNSVFVDEENRTWFSPAAGGLRWMKDGKQGEVRSASLNQDVIYSIAGGKGELWLGRQRGGLTRLDIRNSAFPARTYTTKDGLTQDSVYSTYVAHDGSVWAGTLSGGINWLRDGRVTKFTRVDGLASNTVASILEDSRGVIWLGTPEGLSALTDGRWKTYTDSDGLPSSNVNCLMEDSEGILWVGTTAGLAFRDGERFRVSPAAPSYLNEQILGMAEDNAGSRWIATSNHVLRVARDKLMRGMLSDEDLSEFGISDGLRGGQGVKRHQSVIRDGSGRIWFALNHGIAVVDPARRAGASGRPIVHIQSVSADGHSIGPSTGAVGWFHVPASYRRVEFGYAGLSLATPERIRYRYMLEGFDRGWSAAVPDRSVAYTNLTPRSYRFRVVAESPDGGGAGEQASVAFRVDPLFWQTSWFLALVALALLAICAALYQWRLRLVTERLNVRFEERLAERTRIAQELHDTLLQGFLSASMQLHLTVDNLPEESRLKPSLSGILGVMRAVIEEARNAVRGLRSSPADLDLGRAFSKIQQELPANENTQFQVSVSGDQSALHPLLRDEAYRIGREAVVNAFRHSGASLIEVEVECTDQALRVIVRDNGRGIPPGTLQAGREGHWGLVGMRERAEGIGGKVRLSSSPVAGTEVELSIPGKLAFHGEHAAARARSRSGE